MPRATNPRKNISPNSKRLPNELLLQEASEDVSQEAPVENAPEVSPPPPTATLLQHNTSGIPPENSPLCEPQVNSDIERSKNAHDARPDYPPKPRERLSYTSVVPDLTAIITRIIDHGEHIDNHYAAQGYDVMGMVDTESFLPLGASLHLKTQSLPILDNLVSDFVVWHQDSVLINNRRPKS